MNKTLAILLIAISAYIPAHGEYITPELKDIPLDRLIANVAERVKAEPGNSEALHQFARVHAMAYARNIEDTDLVKTWKGWENNRPAEPWFGHETPHVPFSRLVQGANEKKAETAKAHLTTAIETYKKTLVIKPGDEIIKLGLAWCQNQAGEKDAAIALYREVASTAWKYAGSNAELECSIYVETAGYLIRLLDPTNDAVEIAVLKQRSEKLHSLPSAISPIIIPLADHTALAPLINRDARVRFDLDGTGRQLEWQWITPDAAWLVFDPQHTGKITSAIQMFGNRTFLLFCPDGYQALSLLDDNRDGTLTGHELDGLALWRDANANGISEPGEVRPVTSHGITTLSTRSQQHETGIPFSQNGVTFQDGTTRPTYDIILQTRPPQ